LNENYPQRYRIQVFDDNLEMFLQGPPAVNDINIQLIGTHARFISNITRLHTVNF
jgi:hypothetical protein